MRTLKLYYTEERIRLPKEDGCAADVKNGIFAVADGVHLCRGIEYKGAYPWPSPAGKLAQKFCDVFVKTAKKGSIRNAFRKANRAVFSFNRDRDKFSVFENASAYYAGTAAFMRFRGKYVEYGNICDAGVATVDMRGKSLFWSRDHTHHHGYDLSSYSAVDQTYLLRTIFRNAVGRRGEKKGYGVVTGESEAEIYVNYGHSALKKNVVYLLATDGFEKYLQEQSFRKALSTMDRNQVGKAVARLKKLHKGDGEFLAEKTLIAVRPD